MEVEVLEMSETIKHLHGLFSTEVMIYKYI